MAKAAVQGGYADEVWFMVSPRNPLKVDAQITHDEMRLDMARLLTDGVEGITVSDFEFSLPQPSYTINTLHALEAQYPDCSFRIVIGEDNLHNLHRWRAGDEIASRYGIICYPRHDGEQTSNPIPQGVVIMSDVEYVDVSSTQLRTMVREGQSSEALSRFTSPAVAAYIVENKLYK